MTPEEIRQILDGWALKIRLEAAQVLSAQLGDVVHVKVGGDMGAEFDWIPSAEDLTCVRDSWCQVLPKGVAVLVTHHLESPELIAFGVSDG